MEIVNQTDESYPNQLLQIQNPPKQLYVEGNKQLLKQNCIAIVGSRKATEYGAKYTQIFARELSKAGICIVSGLAIGIDSIAHIHSMNQIGKTIAVLGSGFNYICPKQNYYLYQQIIQNGGCIVTEYPPETVEDKTNYPRRNRIISGLSMGVLVMEAKYRSGSTITARLAIKQNKEVFCIPNRIGEKNSYGTNQLLKDGANLVTCPEDILSFYDKNEIEQEELSIPEGCKITYELIGSLAISANELAKLTNQNIAQTMQNLCMLEIEGLIKQVAGNKYIRIR